MASVVSLLASSVSKSRGNIWRAKKSTGQSSRNSRSIDTPCLPIASMRSSKSDGGSHLNNMTATCFKTGVTRYKLEQFGLPNTLFCSSETADRYVLIGLTSSRRSLTWKIDERNGTSVFLTELRVPW